MIVEAVSVPPRSNLPGFHGVLGSDYGRPSSFPGFPAPLEAERVCHHIFRSAVRWRLAMPGSLLRL